MRRGGMTLYGIRAQSPDHIIQQRYFVYQLCNFVLGVKFGSDTAKRFEWRNNFIRIYDKEDNIVLEGSFADLLCRLRNAKGCE